MTFSRSDADVFVPDGSDPSAALARVTHLCVGAHQDDIEIMAHDAICDCLDQPDRKAFGGVVVTNGSGSPRSGEYARLTDDQMQSVRRTEQRAAATLGRYTIQLQLAHPSADVKTSGHAAVVADLKAIFGGCRPDVVYLHNPADKHDTHIGVLWRCLEALRALPDWVVDAEKVALDSGRRPELGAELLKVFDSQISGGKRYDLAAAGRRAANATYHTSHATDRMAGITWALDLTPLIVDPAFDPVAFTLGAIDRLRNDVEIRLKKFR
jgi:LmbE family N-acetylglucosaminyl deacetylase